MRPIKYILILYQFLFVTILFSQEGEELHKFKHITVNEGLVNNTANVLMQDEKGFVWIGTNNGLQRYDGNEFRTYQKSKGDLGLQSSIIKEVFEDDKNRIWVGTTDGGLTVFSQRDNSSRTITVDNSALKSNDVYCVAQDSLGRVWVGTSSGLEVFSDSLTLLTPKLNSLSIPIEVFEVGIRSIYVVGGNVYVGTELGDVFKFVVDDETVMVDVSDELQSSYGSYESPSAAILDMELDNSGALWLATWDGLFRLIPYGFQNDDFFEHEFELPGQIITSLAYTPDNYMYVGTWGNGVIGYDLDSNNVHRWQYAPNNPNGLNYNDITSLMISADGNLWVGVAWEGGVNILQPNVDYFKHLQVRNDVSSDDKNIVQAFAEGPSGTLFIGTRSGVFWKKQDLSYDVLEITNMPNETIDYPVRSLAFDSVSNVLWIGTDGYGLVEYSLETKLAKWHQLCLQCQNSLSNNSVWDVKIDEYGFVWLGTWGGGVDRLDPKTGIFKHYPIDSENFGQNVALSIEFDRAGRVWVATFGKGVGRLDERTGDFEFFLSDSDGEYLGNGMFYDILIAKNGVVWAASMAGGLIRINPDNNNVRIFDQSNSNVNNVITAINEDDDGNIWVSSEQTLCRIGKSSKTELFTQSHGVQKNTFAIGATVKTKDGKIIFGNSNGYLSFLPDEVVLPKYRVSAEITEILLFDEVVVPNAEYEGGVLLETVPEETDSISVNHDQNSLSFKFTSFDYISGANVNFAYKLDGFDEDWRHTKRNSQTAVYTNLPSGEYTLFVASSSDGNVWNTKLRELKVVVRKPVWEEPWFYTLLGLLVVGAVYLFFRLKTAALRARAKSLQDMVDKRTEKIASQNNELSLKNQEISEYFQEVLAQKEEIKNQRDSLQYHNAELTSSIDYAKLIQEASFPSGHFYSNLFPKSFIIYKPRDIVSGDFYWIAETKRSKVLVVADCTGHGVPGALMSMLGTSLLNEILNQGEIVHAGAVLDELRFKIISSLNQNDAESVSKDGIDMSICVFEKGESSVNYAGANSPLYLVKANGEFIHYKPDKMPVGHHHSKQLPFTNHRIEVEAGDRLYLLSDGFPDQFGGPMGKKFKSSQLKRKLVELRNAPIERQQWQLESSLENWMCNSINGSAEAQVDDIILVGLEVDDSLL